MREQILRSQRVCLPGAADPVPASIWVRDGKIFRILQGGEELPTGILVLDFGDRVILPGIVDTHAHINEPGRTEWEGFETATRAAAAGGITTVIDMPLNSIPATTTLDALKIKAATAQDRCQIDYGFWGGVVPGNAAEILPMVEAGVFGFKVFLCPSGVDEFPMVEEQDLRRAMPILARAGVPLIVHAELESSHSGAAGEPATADFGGDSRKYQTYLKSRPQQWEVNAIRMMIGLARETGCRTHIVHLSAADAIDDLSRARAEGVPITAETCPHYLSFTAEEISDGATHFKCAPPIREKANREKLWQALKRGDIEFVVSDHSPCTPGLKLLEAGDFSRAWGGIAGLQFGLSVVWTGMKERGLTIADLTRWMSENTARFLGLSARKGAIAPGMDADLVIFDPDSASVVEASQVLHRHALTPYSGRTLLGRVEKTFLRGQCIFDLALGDLSEPSPSGERLVRPRTEFQKGSSA